MKKKKKKKKHIQINRKYNCIIKMYNSYMKTQEYLSHLLFRNPGSTFPLGIKRCFRSLLLHNPGSTFPLGTKQCLISLLLHYPWVYLTSKNQEYLSSLLVHNPRIFLTSKNQDCISSLLLNHHVILYLRFSYLLWKYGASLLPYSFQPSYHQCLFTQTTSCL